MSPNTLRDKEHFTSALLKTEAGCGGVLFLDTTRESVLVALNCTLLESLQEEILTRLSFKERTAFARSIGRRSEASGLDL